MFSLKYKQGDGFSIEGGIETLRWSVQRGVSPDGTSLQDCVKVVMTLTDGRTKELLLSDSVYLLNNEGKTVEVIKR